jgi:hypothetical protein
MAPVIGSVDVRDDILKKDLEILHLFYTTLAAMAAENKPICFTFN